MMRFKILQNYTAKNKKIMAELDELISNCNKIYNRLILLKHNLPREEDEKVRLKNEFIYKILPHFYFSTRGILDHVTTVDLLIGQKNITTRLNHTSKIVFLF